MFKNAFQSATLLLAAGLALSGCAGMFFADVEDTSVAMTRDFAGLPGSNHLPGAPAGPVDIPVTVPLPPATSNFNADIPLTKQDPNGTVKVTTNLSLNGADVAMKSDTGDLAGVSSAQLRVFDPGADPSAAQAKVIATYTRPSGTAAGTKTIHFVKTGDVNLVDYLSNKQMGVQLALTVQGAVNLPQADWSADLTLDFFVKTRAEAP